MTKEEIVKASDEAVDEIMNVEFWDTGIRRIQKNEATKIAILHYEKIVELAESVDLYFKVDDYKAILTELKSRL